MSNWKVNQPNDAWAKVKPARDPVSGKVVPQTDGSPKSLAKEMGTEVSPRGGRGGVNQAG
jgi:hypothetical protein